MKLAAGRPRDAPRGRRTCSGCADSRDGGLAVSPARATVSVNVREMSRLASRGGWLETPDRGVAVRHGLVWRAHTSFKTGSTRYWLTASAIPPILLPFLPFSLPTLPPSRSARDRSNTVRSRDTPAIFTRRSQLSSHGAPSRNDIDAREVVSKSSSPSSFRDLPVRSRIF